MRTLHPASDPEHRTGSVSPACTGPCRQGLDACPCPNDCHVPEKSAGWDWTILASWTAMWGSGSPLIAVLAVALSALGAIFWPH